MHSSETYSTAKPLNKSFCSVSKSDKIYRAHAYWTKQSIPVIRQFIEHFTREGDLVLDCFAGTGMTGLASILDRRNCLLMDTSAVCCHIAKGYCTPVDTHAAQEIFDKIMKALQRNRELLTYTHCECNNETEIAFTVVGEVYLCPLCNNEINVGLQLYANIKADKKRKGETFKCPNCGRSYHKSSMKFLRFEPMVIVYDCDYCGRRRRRVEYDELLQWRCEGKFEEIRYPTARFIGAESKRNLAKGIEYTHQLYSRKNLVSLSLLFEEIGRIMEVKMRRFFLFVFTSILFNVSLMSAYRKYENTSIRMGTLYIPSVIKDNNVFLSFERKFRSILRMNYSLFKNGRKQIGDVEIKKMSANEIGEILGPESIDYVFIDPPYSDIINYSDLNVVWEAWLPEKTDASKEILVDRSCGKTLEYYESKMTEAFANLNYVLKPRHWLTLVFHHPKPLHWASIQSAISKTHLQPYLEEEPKVIRSKSRTASQLITNKRVQGFLIMNFRKEPNSSMALKELDKGTFNRVIIDLIKEGEMKELKSKSQLYDYLIYKLFPRVRIKDFDFDYLRKVAQQLL